MHKAVHPDIYENLKQRIRQRSFDGGRLPPERQLAAEYGVTRLTLRKALKVLDAEGLIARLGAKGTFVVEKEPLPVTGTVRKIAYIQIEKNREPLGVYHGTIMSAIEKGVRKNRSSMLFYNVGSASEIEHLFSPALPAEELDAVIIAGGVTPRILKQVRQVQFPVLLIGRLTCADSVEDEVDQVMDDPDAYTREGMRFLLGRGCRRIAFVDCSAYQWGMIAQQRYMQMLEDEDIEYREELVLRCGSSRMRDAFELGANIATLNVDGVFVRHDIVARGFYDGLAARGIVAGKDLQWMSVGHRGDNVEHLHLPRMVVDPAEIAQAALETLATRLAKPGVPVIKRIIPHHAAGFDTEKSPPV